MKIEKKNFLLIKKVFKLKIARKNFKTLIKKKSLNKS